MTTNVQETSLEAYYSEIKRGLGHRQKTVYEVLEKRNDWTNTEIAMYLDWPINTVTPRIFELRKAGLVTEHSKRICSITGRRACSWQLIKNTLF